jgi:hypothetical protein
MKTIEIKVPCEIHGLEIYHSEGGKDYCEECMVERVERNIEGYSAKTIARWIHKNANLDNDWWTIFKYAQCYPIEELDGVILNPEFYSKFLKSKQKRFIRLNKGEFLAEEIDKEEY